MPRLHDNPRLRLVPAFAALRPLAPDPNHELDLAAQMREQLEANEVLALFYRFGRLPTWFDMLMRRICLRALVRRCGCGLVIGTDVRLRNPETMEFGDGVSIGDGVIIQGRHDGRCVIGDRSWIGPQCYLDARDLEIGAHVGLGPGVRVLGSEHTGVPAGIPLVATDLAIAPVRVEAGADVGTGAVLLRGVTVGAGAIVGAGAVVTKDVPPHSKVAGVPARVIGWRGTAEGAG